MEDRRLDDNIKTEAGKLDCEEVNLNVQCQTKVSWC
jgi:hypothetical protein